MQRFPISNIYSKLTTGFIWVTDIAWRAVAVLAVVDDVAEGVEPTPQGARVAAGAGPALLVYWTVCVGNASCKEGREIIIPLLHWC